MISITEWQKIGMGTTGFGVFFILLGVLLYFDSVLLAFGNRHKLKGTSFFLGGVAIVLLRWPLLGMFLETYGFFNLFKGFFPVAFGFLGNAFNIPFLSSVGLPHLLFSLLFHSTRADEVRGPGAVVPKGWV
ncbi:vesicle transport protein GOT1A isoform X3 [Rhinolophus sinicus]|uniref:vesicle transport protein GOT1A isoform X3 n=1 Tax=Rhinolophus sinicus TaxID=89399 RepID=UPI003D7B6D96